LTTILFSISNFLPVVNVVFFLLDDYPATEFYVMIFWNAVCSIFIGRDKLWRWSIQSVPKCQHIKFRRWGITQMIEHNNTLIVT